MIDIIGQLLNLIEVTGLQRVQDELAAGSGLAMLMVDYLGNPVTRHSCCSAFCNAARLDKKYAELCKKCDSRGGIEAARLHKPYIYTCHMGVTDFAIPIMLDGEYIGAILGGQVTCSDGAYEAVVSELTDIPDNLRVLRDKLPSYDTARIDALAQMVFFLMNYILGEGRTKLSQNDTAATQYPNPSDVEKGSVSPAVRYIDLHFKESLTLAQMAGLCELSPTYFCKQFKKLMGCNFTEYINAKRIECAKKLLVETNRSITDVAYELGYEDSGYFIKVFKRLTGMTPHTFRQNRK